MAGPKEYTRRHWQVNNDAPRMNATKRAERRWNRPRRHDGPVHIGEVLPDVLRSIGMPEALILEALSRSTKTGEGGAREH